MKKEAGSVQDVTLRGISEATSEEVLPDTHERDDSPPTWLSIEGLRQLAGIALLIRERIAAVGGNGAGTDQGLAGRGDGSPPRPPGSEGLVEQEGGGSPVTERREDGDR